MTASQLMEIRQSIMNQYGGIIQFYGMINVLIIQMMKLLLMKIAQKGKC